MLHTVHYTTLVQSVRRSQQGPFLVLAVDRVACSNIGAAGSAFFASHPKFVMKSISMSVFLSAFLVVEQLQYHTTKVLVYTYVNSYWYHITHGLPLPVDALLYPARGTMEVQGR